MPWTFAHPAAVIPLRRYCPAPLNFPALVIGSITPDLAYHVSRKDIAYVAHSFEGSLLVCLPSGLLLLALLCLLRKPLWYLLPEPHRSALAPVAASRLSPGLATMFWAALSVVLGAWTHILWDGLTHDNGWFVLRAPFLQESVFQMAGFEVHLYNVLQHFSTCLGVVVLVASYWRWLAGTQDLRRLAHFEREDLWRYAVLASLTIVAIGIALTFAVAAAERFHGLYAWRVFLFRGAVDGMSAFILLYLLGALICYRARRTA